MPGDVTSSDNLATLGQPDAGIHEDCRRSDCSVTLRTRVAGSLLGSSCMVPCSWIHHAR